MRLLQKCPHESAGVARAKYYRPGGWNSTNETRSLKSRCWQNQAPLETSREDPCALELAVGPGIPRLAGISLQAVPLSSFFLGVCVCVFLFLHMF